MVNEFAHVADLLQLSNAGKAVQTNGAPSKISAALPKSSKMSG
jgi:hypothetical protein